MDTLDSFEKIGPHLLKCKTCGKEVKTGIVNISTHWCSCTGKEFYDALIENAKANTKLTPDDIFKIHKKHLK